eukprot:4849942-Pleurochrysis_carterae.AAC.1
MPTTMAKGSLCTGVVESTAERPLEKRSLPGHGAMEQDQGGGARGARARQHVHACGGRARTLEQPVERARCAGGASERGVGGRLVGRALEVEEGQRRADELGQLRVLAQPLDLAREDVVDAA